LPTYWCLVTSPDNIARTRALGFTVQGIKKAHRKKAEKMQPGDRILLYATQRQAFAFTATITSPYFEDHSPIWTSDKAGEDYPFRFDITPDVVLDEVDYVPAAAMVEQMEYARKWPPQHWRLAFQGNVHVLPEHDFSLIEDAMTEVAKAPAPAAS
jgi:hypothetical protein